MKMNCKLDLPYPEVKTEGRNLCYARLLSNDFAGAVSELTAITKYLFQHLMIDDDYPELAATIECISMVEMKHMEMLGELIVDLGGEPMYRAGNCWWNGSFAVTAVERNKMLRENIAGERTAIANYRQRIMQIEDRWVQKVLERIIKDEEHHIKLFEQFLR